MDPELFLYTAIEKTSMPSGNGRASILTFDDRPNRVVSLVPSMTDSLVELGLQGVIVGVTDFCVLETESGIARVGGTKSPELETILSLQPDLVIANMEENSRKSVEAMEEHGLKVWVTFPKSVEDAITVLRAVMDLFRVKDRVERIQTLELALDWTTRAASERARVFCPIWYEPDQSWMMTFNKDTYAHDVLYHCGGENVFADRERKYPLAADLGLAEAEQAGERDIRYPRLTIEEIEASEPDVILLPSEPFAFKEPHIEQISKLLPEIQAVRANRMHLVDGSLITWHGTRLGKALAELPEFLQPVLN
jgi:ABC-type Fe3+-hydroxamate transport system substrate-binding protein